MAEVVFSATTRSSVPDIRAIVSRSSAYWLTRYPSARSGQRWP